MLPIELFLAYTLMETAECQHRCAAAGAEEGTVECIGCGEVMSEDEFWQLERDLSDA